MQRRMKPELSKGCILFPGALVYGSIHLDSFVSIWYGAILRGDIEAIRLGEACNVQDGALIHTSRGNPVSLAKGVSVGHKAVIHGACVKDYVLIGINASIMDGAVLGEYSRIAAGAVVAPGTLVAPGVLMAGVPAQVKRDLRQDEINYQIELAELYKKRAFEYRRGEFSFPWINFKYPLKRFYFS